MKYTVLKSWESDQLKDPGILEDQLIELDSTNRHFALQIHPKAGKIPLEPVQSGEFHPAEHLRQN